MFIFTYHVSSNSAFSILYMYDPFGDRDIGTLWSPCSLVPVAKTNLCQISRLGYSREYRGKWMIAKNPYWFTVSVHWYLWWLCFWYFSNVLWKTKKDYSFQSSFHTLKTFICIQIWLNLDFMCADPEFFQKGGLGRGEQKRELVG